MITMYGQPPSDGGAGRWPWPKPDAVPNPTIPTTGTFIGGAPAPPPAPEGPDEIRKRIGRRIEWLKKELSMMAAWRDELALLERMLAAMQPSPDVQSEELKP